MLCTPIHMYSVCVAHMWLETVQSHHYHRHQLVGWWKEQRGQICPDTNSQTYLQYLCFWKSSCLQWRHWFETLHNSGCWTWLLDRKLDLWRLMRSCSSTRYVVWNNFKTISIFAIKDVKKHISLFYHQVVLFFSDDSCLVHRLRTIDWSVNLTDSLWQLLDRN
jgi:hypothetical protein